MYYKMWDDVFVLRRVSDSKILQRVWVDTIKTTSCDVKDELVVFHFVDKASPPLLLYCQQVRS